MRGSSARSGPAPDPNALSRDRKTDAGWTTLYPRTGDVPAWPLTESSKREDAMWSRLWTTPQATQWEALGLVDEVATYVRTFCEASVVDGSVNARTLVLRQQETLGLSMPGLQRNRWRISTDELAKPEAARTDDSRRAAAKSRFKTIPGGAA